MLGTFLGMVVTLNGTGSALESATDLEAIRSSLAAPVKGLGLAFGTSVAGVAASAMLGLLSALCRRDRLQAAQWLDTRIATTLRMFSLSHQREESFKLLQQQTHAMPALVDRLQHMMATMERQSQALNERLIAGQNDFHGKAEAAYAGLASSVGPLPEQSLTESARVAGATFQPVVEAAMAGIAREAASLHATIEQSVQRQLDGLSNRFETSTTQVADIWESARRRTAASERSAIQRLAQLARPVRRNLRTTLCITGWKASPPAWKPLSMVCRTPGEAPWNSKSASARTLSGDTHRALTTAAATFEQHSASLLRTVGQAHADLQTEVASRDQQRLAAWTQALESMATSLQQEWQQAGARTESQQQAICEDAGRHRARYLCPDGNARERTRSPRSPNSCKPPPKRRGPRPKSIAELRQKLSDSMARDNAMLEERSRILETLETLLDAVNHASTEQRAAIDALVGASADLLDRVGTRFTDKVEAETDKTGRRRRADHRQRRRSGEPGRSIRLGRAAVQPVERQAGDPPAAHRRRARQVALRAVTNSSPTTWRRRGKSST